MRRWLPPTVSLVVFLASNGAAGASVIHEDKVLVASDDPGGLARFNAVAMDGDWLVASRPFVNGVPPAVAFFQKVGGEWVEQKIRFAIGWIPAENFGESIAIRGDVVVVGSVAPTGNAPGAVYVYRRAGITNWFQEQRLVGSDSVVGDDFGASVDTDGARIVVGAPKRMEAAANDGAAYVFRHDGTTWTEEQKLTEAASGSKRYGTAVSIEGTELFVGASQSVSALRRYLFDGTSWNGVGSLASTFGSLGRSVSRQGSRLIAATTAPATASRAIVFDFDGTNWIESSDLAPHEDAGMSGPVDVDGLRAVISTPHAIYLFEFSSGAWSETRVFSALPTTFVDDFDVHVAIVGTDIVAGGGFAYSTTQEPAVQPELEDGKQAPAMPIAGASYGNSIAIDDGVLVVGAPLDQSASVATGAAYVYQRVGGVGGHWSNEVRIAGSTSNGRFGFDVAIDGDTIAIGAPDEGNGQVHVYRRMAGGAVVLEQTLSGPGLYYGFSVDVEGDRIAVGAPLVNSGLGAVRVYHRQGTVWSQEAVLSPPGSGTQFFGHDVDLSGDGLIVGSSAGMGMVFSGVGNARVYRFSAGSWSEEAVLHDNQNQALAYFGYRVALDGDRAVVSRVLLWNLEAPYYAVDRNVHVFEKQSGVWNRVQILVPEEIVVGSYGYALDLDGDRLLVGSWGQCGTAFYYLHNGTSFSYVIPLSHSSAVTHDGYAAGVAFAGALATVGATHDGVGGTINDAILPGLGLMTIPALVAAGDDLTFRTGGGSVAKPTLLVITGVNATPLFVSVLLGAFDAEGQFEFTVPVPAHPALPGAEVDFQAFTTDASGFVVPSNERTVRFE